jgi:phospho-N-acetylmuramoyl-pentapeptide-transferase
MIDILVTLLKDNGVDFGFFRLLDFITFRVLLTALTALVFLLAFGHRIIVELYQKRMRDTGTDFAALDMRNKRGTPTAGGVMIIFAVFFAVFLWGKLGNPYLRVILFSFLYFGLIGWFDDTQKVRMKSSLFGLSQLAKTVLQLLFIVPYAIWFVSPFNPIPAAHHTEIWVPFVKYPLMDIGPYLFIAFIVFAFFSILNAVNITDGLDGLVTGPSILAVAAYGIFAYILGNTVLSGYFLFPYFPGCGELTVFAGALGGALFGFLWYNAYPAEVFMGDTGSLAIGGALAVIAFQTRQEMLFPLAGGIFVVMIFSSLVQEKIGMRLGRRILIRAPIHHSLRYRGIAEPKVVTRLWIISTLMVLVALLSIKLR